NVLKFFNLHFGSPFIVVMGARLTPAALSRAAMRPSSIAAQGRDFSWAWEQPARLRAIAGQSLRGSRAGRRRRAELRECDLREPAGGHSSGLSEVAETSRPNCTRGAVRCRKCRLARGALLWNAPRRKHRKNRAQKIAFAADGRQSGG